MAFYKYKGTLAELFPDIAKDWHPTKNGDKTPNNITPGVCYKAWWLCDKGHEWSVSVSTRVNQKTGCPYCGNKKLLKGYNDLLTVRPDVAKDWDYTKNYPLKPTDISKANTKKVWWVCSKCGESFINSTHNRCRNKSLYCVDCTRKLKCK